MNQTSTNKTIVYYLQSMLESSRVAAPVDTHAHAPGDRGHGGGTLLVAGRQQLVTTILAAKDDGVSTPLETRRVSHAFGRTAEVWSDINKIVSTLLHIRGEISVSFSLA